MSSAFGGAGWALGGSGRGTGGTSSMRVATVFLFPRRRSTSDMCTLESSRTLS